MIYLSQNLKFLRHQRELTQYQLGELIDKSQSWIERCESEDLVPDAYELAHLSEKLDFTVDELLKVNLKERYYAYKEVEIHFLALDVDGVLTDGGMYFTDEGNEIKKYNTKDGMAIQRLVKNDYGVGFISSGFNETVVESRGNVLEVDKVYVGTRSKDDVLSKWLEEMEVSEEEVAFIGDDLNDISIMEHVGLTACPSDATPSVKKVADIVLNKRGGAGCVREFVDHYLPIETL